MSHAPLESPRNADWLALALGQAQYRYNLETWTNETTFGTDRYHCLASTLGSVLQREVPGARVSRPVDDFGSPFIVEMSGGMLYPHRYGQAASDDTEGWKLKPDSWIQSRMVAGPANGQGVLDYPGMPQLPLSRIVFLAWAGNRHEGLTRAFLGVTYLGADGRVYWRGKPEELIVAPSPSTSASAERPRHELRIVRDPNPPSPPALDLRIRDDASLIDLFGEDPG